jgi:hypothetical protein
MERNETPPHCEASAGHALEVYRERRRRRRGEDTYFGSSAALLEADDDGPRGETERRRSEIMADAEADGMPSELAELLYDIARDEGLDPALGYELVRTGLGVAPPADGLSNAPDDPTVDRYLPAWMFPPEPTDHMLRERMLRFSFRRVRSFLEDEEDLDEAFRRFAAEPDVGHYGY